MGTGITPPTERPANFEAGRRLAAHSRAPPYPFNIDEALAAQGAPVYKQYCAGCHGADGKDFSGEYAGKVMPIDEIGTDRHRLTRIPMTSR